VHRYGHGEEMNKTETKIKVKQVQWFDEHWYRIDYVDGSVDYFPSTTTKMQVLDKPGLTMWYGSLGSREAKKRTMDAADRGSRIHNALEIMGGGGAVVYQHLQHPNYNGEELYEIKKKYKEVVILERQDEMLQVWKVQKLFKILDPVFLEREKIVWSTKYREAGTIDIVLGIRGGKYEGIARKPVELEEGIYITDYKTGNLYDEAKMQIADYIEMFIERFPQHKNKVKGGLIIHTGARNRTGIPGLSLIYIPMAEVKKDFVDFRHVAAMWDRKYGPEKKPRLLDFPAIITLETTKG